MIDRERIKQRAKLIRPLSVPMVLYFVLSILGVSLALKMGNSPWRYVVVLLPMLPGLFLAFGIVRAIAKFDELERLIILEAAAFSFIFTLILLLSFGLLGLVGVSQPSNTTIMLIMGILMVVGKLWGNWKHR